MSDLRTHLERIGERARAAPEAFQRLERKRRRRERNRRIGAGVVALAVAVAGSFAAFTAFRGGDPEVASGDDGFFALWPESTLQQALSEQEAVDNGMRRWRLSATETAAEFARTALGWGAPDEGGVNVEIDAGVDVDGPGPITLSVYRTPGGQEARITEVTLERLIRPEGIWSVVDVRSEVFDLRLSPGGEVEVGGFIAIPTTLEEGTEVAVGVAGTSSCLGFHEQTTAVLDGYVVVPVTGLNEGCNGYVYVLTPSTPVGQVELGRIMFVYHDAKPALEYTIEAVAAVPIRFVASEGEPPSVEPTPEGALRVACDRTMIESDVRVVARSTGVHVIVDNTSADPLFFQLAPERLGPWGGIEVQPGITELALQAPPGTMTIRCSTEGSPTDEIAVEVLDPESLFVPFTVTCPGVPEIAYTISVTAWEGTEAVPEPVEFVRSRVEGLLPSDIVEGAGYPEAPNPAVRAVRDGAVVAGFELYLDNGQWGVGGTWCSEMGIVVPPGPDPYPRGAFEWCPAGPFPETGFQWRERASEAAVQFVHADMNGDETTVTALLDESVPAGADFPIALAGDAAVVIGASAAGGELVRFACGPDVDAYTVAITIDDGTDSASMDFTVFLVFRG
ncbi:MAG: hypothetical protein ACRDGW_00810, partial [Actinomycetota bacterium]